MSRANSSVHAELFSIDVLAVGRELKSTPLDYLLDFRFGSFSTDSVYARDVRYPPISVQNNGHRRSSRPSLNSKGAYAVWCDVGFSGRDQANANPSGCHLSVEISKARKVIFVKCEGPDIFHAFLVRYGARAVRTRDSIYRRN